MLSAELEKELNDLRILMDDSIGIVNTAAKEAQELVFKALIDLVNRFELSDGRFVQNQDLSPRLAALEKIITDILGEHYAPAVSEYLGSYRTIENVNISLQKSFNDLEVDVDKLSPARKTIYNNASYYLKAGLKGAYIQPAKYLLMQQVTTGISIKDSIKQLNKWNAGSLTGGVVPGGRQMPNLQKYATQVARDSLYQYDGQINNIIKNEYDLNEFIYVGDVIEDSRPLCVHLVGLRRDISLEEISALIKKFPEGLYPDTNKENFIQYRGGYSCRHSAFPVRAKKN